MNKPPKPPSEELDKFLLRMPEGLRERIKQSADRNGRSMNAEINKALEEMFPPQPSIEQVLDRVHHGIALAKSSSFPYRQTLIDALSDLNEMIASGIEFDQFRSKLPPDYVNHDFADYYAALTRLKRASVAGVETSDLEREIEKGLLHRLSRNDMQNIIKRLRQGKRENALKIMRLDNIRFSDPDAAFAAIERDLVAFYEENWGDPEELLIPDEF